MGLKTAYFLSLVSLASAVPWISSLSLGVDYYPETWEEAQWEVDAAAMEAAGMTTVRVAEFTWHKFQPSVGAAYNFSWLDRALDVLSSHGICAIVGTPTASPPQWLYKLDPTIALVNSNGLRAGTGSRQNMNHLHPLIQSSTRDIVSALARHYANDTRVCAFQIDNEIHGEPDFSDITQVAFASWLSIKFNGSTDAMNAAWGTQFWGEEYDAFTDVPLPWDTPDGHNPGLALDYRRFIAHVGASYLELQAGILRDLAPGKPLTTNCMGTYTAVDYSRFASSLDAVSFDNYPLSWWYGSHPPNYSQANEVMIYTNAFSLSVMRGAKAGAPFFIMEHQVSNTGQFFYYGSGWAAGIRLATWQSIANGADGVQYFRWRTTRWGQEQHWEGVLNWDGALTAPRYAAVTAIGAELNRVSPHVFGGRVRARVAVLWSLETSWAFQEQTITGAGAPVFDASVQARALFAAFRAYGEAVDIVFLPAENGVTPPVPLNLTGYQIVLAPTLYVVPDAVAAALSAFVASGGQLFLSMRSGAKDAHNAYVGAPLPGPFAALAGLSMEQWDPLCSLGESALVPGNFSFATPSAWNTSTTQGCLCELLVPAPDVLVLARYQSGVYAGLPALTLLRRSGGGGGVP